MINNESHYVWSIKTFSCKQSGNDGVIDLSPAKPREIPAELFVVKVSGVK